MTLTTMYSPMKGLLILASLVASLSASGVPITGSDTMTEMQRFYYNLGEKSGHIDGVKEGYSLALKEFSSLVAGYKHKVKALEAGKYLVDSGKITYPKVYKIRNGSSYEIKIKAPVVEKEFTSEDLFLIPLLRSEDELPDSADMPLPTSTMYESSEEEEKQVGNQNAFDLPDIESTTKTLRPNSVGGVRAHNSLEIPYKSSSVKGVLEVFGSDYSETKTGYIVNFSNDREKKKFCKELTGDSTCSNLTAKNGD